MRFSALSFLSKMLPGAALAALMSLACTPSHAQDDPPAQAGRLSSVQGAVSIQPAGSDNWGQAYANLPLGPGDRIFTDSDARVEVQVGQSYIRIGPNSDVSFVDSTEQGIIFGVAQGAVHIHSLGLWPGQSLIVQTPSGSASLSHPGEMRVDVLPDDDSAIFTDLSQELFVTAAGNLGVHVGQFQALQLTGSNPVYPQWLQAGDPDSLDRWSRMRDEQIANAVSYRYVSQEIPGAAELDAAGDWTPDTDYGAVWFPRNVPAGWAPYHYGHWVNHAPWGWVWVEDESWGYAPFHYGRWVSMGGRWGWIPGPREARPVYSPALVVFAGGIQAGGGGVSVWFPLGPGEAYKPWYPCSPRYIDQVNISNIRESRVVHVQTTYVNVVNVTNVVYVNRSIGFTAVSHDDFAAGRPAAQVAVHLDVHVMDHVTVLDRPVVKPTAQSFVGRPPARPVPVNTARPALINTEGKLVISKPGAKPMEPPVKAVSAPKPIAGHPVVAPPPGAPKFAAPAKAAPQPEKPETKPAPVANPVAAPSPRPVAKPAEEPAMKPVPPVEKTATPPNAKSVPPTAPKPAGAPAEQPAPKAVPPAAPKPPSPAAAKPAPAPVEKPGATPAKDKKTEKDKQKKDEKSPDK